MKQLIPFFCLLFLSLPATAGNIPEKNWGIAIGYRIARIPYPSNDKQVSDVIPLLFYDGDTFFIHGLSGGIKLYNKKQWQFSLLGRYRYFDIPAAYQNQVRGDGLDVGGQLKYRVNDKLEANAEIMSDNEGRFYTALNTRYHVDSGSLEFVPYATLRLKSADFNNRYFGLDGFHNPDNPSQIFKNKIGTGLDLTLGSELRYHVISNLYLIGRAQLTTLLDNSTRNAASIDRNTFGEVYLGVAFFNDKTGKKTSSLKAKPYIRIAHGWASPSSIGEIIKFQSEPDAQNNQFNSIFYGYPIADSLFGINAFDIYITTGFVYHQHAGAYKQVLSPGEGINSADLKYLSENACDGVNPCTITYERQPTTEYDIAMKAYYNLYWPVHWRVGLAEGLSYVSTVTNIEQREMDQKGYRASKLVNFLDFTLDLSLGDTFGVKSIDDLYFGIGVHHRSSIFESSSAFGRIKGGSNYISTYLQYHF